MQVSLMKRLLAFLLTALLAVSPAYAVMVQIPAQGFVMPQWIIISPLAEDSSGSAAAMTATGTKIMVYGRVFQKDLNFRQGAVTKSITSVSFATQTVTCAGCGTTLQIDIEGVTVSAGPPAQPDGVIAGGGNALGTVALPVTQNSWVTGPTFATPAVVHYGDLIAVVFSYSVFGSSGVFNLRANTGGFIGTPNFGSNFATFNATTWAIGSSPVVNVILNFSDGTSGTFSGAWPYAATASFTSYNSASNPNELGLQFSLPFNAQIDQLCAAGQVSGGAGSATLELTDNNSVPNVLASVVMDGHVAQGSGGINGTGCEAIPVQNIQKNTIYNVGYLATAAGTNVGMQAMTFGAASNLDSVPGGGQQFAAVTRHGGPWSAPSLTTRYQIGFVVSAIDDGTGPAKPPVYNGMSQ